MTTIPVPSPAAPTREVVDVAGSTLSALVCEVPEPRAVVFAVHGGATTSAYFDCPGRPRLSLLRTAAGLGFTAIALDRPGYGASAADAERFPTAGQRLDAVVAALEVLLAHRDTGAGVFLLAHSAGCETVLRLAGGDRVPGVIGIELAGTGLRHARGGTGARTPEPRRDAPPAPGRSALRALLWGPEELYPSDVYADGRIAARFPAYEYEWEARSWTEDFSRLAGRVRVPVQFSLGEHERVWCSGPGALAEVAACFTASPLVRTYEQAHAGHNLSLGLTARAYHLRALAFAEECAVLRETDGAR
ncbi:alpha/beta fold hydrolase [Streptomyces sp. NPDC052052]|uniref:alpha/beta hydrolase n=1 Tax=Streptomyces sp. NPDC052052 TaxID=3154756 RepID=UPI003449B792